MRHWLALMMMFALLNVISVCPMLAGQMQANASCCQHSTDKDLPCTESTPDNCPYVLLEKSTAERAASVLALAAAAACSLAQNDPDLRQETLLPDLPSIDRSDSFLVFRVLRI